MTALTKVRDELIAKSKAYYIKGVNINYSFKTLEKMANGKGLKFENGDILVVDNHKGDKRKAFKKTPDGSIIVYVGLSRGLTFLDMPKHSTGRQQTLEYFNYK